MLSKRSKYALKALLVLAEEGGTGLHQSSELAERQGLPKKFLEAILFQLTRHGLLQSRKGRGGGYILSRKPGDITVGDVIRALDGPLALVPCVSQTAYRRCEECLEEDTCGVRLVMKEVRDATSHILDNTTLAGLYVRVAASRRANADVRDAQPRSALRRSTRPET
jgi:Rrf2 family protein